MSSKYWLEYVKSCYDLILESQGVARVFLEHEVEAYLVHLMANNFERSSIGDNPVAIMLMNAMATKNEKDFLSVGDECLLIHSWPLKQRYWPSTHYYMDMGTMAYGFAGHIMEKNFQTAGKILNIMFSRKLSVSNPYGLT